MFEEHQKCYNRECRRRVRVGVRYCCDSCGLADEKGYEIHEEGPLGHSQTCNGRRAERGEYTAAEALAYAQKRDDD